MKTLVLIFVLINISSSLAKPNHINGGFSLDLIDRDSPQSPLYNPSYAQFDHLKNAFQRSTYRASHLSKRAGFTIDLIERESLLSPFYNAKYASSDRLKSAFLGSMSGASHFSRKSGLIDADISNNFGEYLMSIDIGTPPVKVLGIVDTGSDLTWAQCEPCESCYEQVGPILVPSNSSTYQPLTCQNKGFLCQPTSQHSCDSNNICRYKIGYGDGSHTTGDLAIDTFWFGQTSFKNVVFGCGHDNNGKFNKEGSGIIGLGGGPLSLINQLDVVTQGIFSYCLIPNFNDGTNQTSKMQFGYYAKVTGPNVVSTPLVKKDPSTFYYLTLESVLVGQNNVSSNNSFSKKDVQEGNIIIDSGTTLTFIDQELYEELTLDLTEVLGSPIALDPDGFFQYCYKDLNMDTVPTVTFRFTDADVELPPVNTFLEVQKGMSCLTIVPSTDIAIFGNLSQRYLLVGYDLINNKVYFKHVDCTKYA
ncbi:aspartic proteinase CDR1-like protein [Tanacetum coccineum]|uniref:Aspartic proteinase CDR1-like protein n=1 Tax=Tanacetum coccineum TaxID=301880 RepID=A0ABQ5AIQ8_9ASTR